MRDAAWVADAVGGELLAGDPAAPGPRRAVVDSREAGEGDLFVGLHGATPTVTRRSSRRSRALPRATSS